MIIKDTSYVGVSLCVRRRFDVSVLVNLMFVMDRDGSTTSRIIRVRRVQAFDESVWQVGCAFISPLDQQLLDSFLNNRMQVTSAL